MQSSSGTWSLLFIYLQSPFPFQAVKLATSTYTSCTPSCKHSLTYKRALMHLIYWCIKENALYYRVSHIRGTSKCLTIISITPPMQLQTNLPLMCPLKPPHSQSPLSGQESPDNLPVVTGYTHHYGECGNRGHYNCVH